MESKGFQSQPSIDPPTDVPRCNRPYDIRDAVLKTLETFRLHFEPIRGPPANRRQEEVDKDCLSHSISKKGGLYAQGRM
jgi:hypothetical protein